MHKSVMNFLDHHIKREEVSGKRVLEIGSLNINGSPREIICPMGPAVYIGLDEQSGPGVDIQMSADYLYTFFIEDSFDLVVTTETLEHVKNWRQFILQIKRVLRPGGIVVLTCRAPGYQYHDQPADYWRFTLEDMRKIFADYHLRHLQADPEIPGVMAKFQKPFPVDLAQIEPSPIR